MSMLKNTASDAMYDVSSVANDGTDLARTAGAFMITAATAIKINTKDGTTITFASGDLQNGTVYPLALSRVWSAGTTDKTKVVLFYGKY